MARYFASKLWMGESWYLQIDAHSNFAPGWDIDSVNMLKKAPSGKPVISHYPPAAESVNFLHERSQAAPRICGGVFAGTDIEAQIVRLEEQGVSMNVYYVYSLCYEIGPDLTIIIVCI
jgi:hypothetical protein